MRNYDVVCGRWRLQVFSHKVVVGRCSVTKLNVPGCVLCVCQTLNPTIVCGRFSSGGSTWADDFHTYFIDWCPEHIQWVHLPSLSGSLKMSRTL